MSIGVTSSNADKQLIQDLVDQRDEARDDARRLRETLAAQASPEDIAVIDRAVAARIIDLRRDATLNGTPMSEEDWREMDSLTRAWERVRNLLGRR